MLFRDEVDRSDIHPLLWAFLGAIAHRHRQVTGEELVVTSLRRFGEPGSSGHTPLHGQLATAADVRRWALDAIDGAETFARGLQADYGASLGVVLEPEWLSEEQLALRGGRAAVAPHIHVQLKPTKGWGVL